MTNEHRRAATVRTWFIKKSVEPRMFLGYALIVLRPGATPPQLHRPESDAPTHAPENWETDEYQLYIDEARRDMDDQQAEKRDIRARAQIVLTTVFFLGAAAVASYTHKSHLGAGWTLLYVLAAVCIICTGLAAGGIITARSSIGGPRLSNLLRTGAGDVHRRLADEYAATRWDGDATIAVLITVLRDCVLVLILGAGLLAIAHIWA